MSRFLARLPLRTADVSALEGEIDRLVYALYGLTEEEMRIVEGRKSFSVVVITLDVEILPLDEAGKSVL